MSDSAELAIVRGKKFFNEPFHNNILSTNIAVYQYLANILFKNDMERVVWASTDLMFRKRQEQLQARKNYKKPEADLGLLDLPFCAFRLTQDGVQPKTDRNWWNPALHTKGMWFEELKRRLRLTPVTLNYEACFCCNHDTDLFMVQQNLIWEKNAETILESFIDATDSENNTYTLKNIVICDPSPKMNSTFTEKDWLEKNKIQTIVLDISCQTWLIAEDPYHRYSITKKVALDFLHGANYYNSIENEADIDSKAEDAIWGIFAEGNVGNPLLEEEEEEEEGVNK